MKRLALRAAIPFVAMVAFLAIPGVASADTLEAAVDGTLKDTVPINTLWVMISAILVLFMQAGFLLLEVGFSRSK
nr:ammonium transporter [Thermoleophilaceae bacterium]